MKKTLSIFLALALVLALMVGCEKTPAVEDIVSQFDPAVYEAQTYGETMLETVRTGLENNNISLTGELLAVVHLLGSPDPSAPFVWAYVYEFSDEKDAVAVEENRRAFVEGGEQNGACVRFGRVVVFGTSPTIELLLP